MKLVDLYGICLFLLIVASACNTSDYPVVVAPSSVTTTPIVLSTSTPSPTLISTATNMATVSPTSTSTPTPIPTKKPFPNCEEDFENYSDAIPDFLENVSNSLHDLYTWLHKCKVTNHHLEKASTVFEPVQYQETKGIAIFIYDPNQETVDTSETLLVYHMNDGHYDLMFSTTMFWYGEFLGIDDINDDGKIELVWTDGKCGAHTCLFTVFVEHWTGMDYKSWVINPQEMQNSTYSFAEITSEGTGYEIVVSGDFIGSVGAGLQQGRTVTYYSPDGGPYKLHTDALDPPEYLYQQIVDGNTLFNQGDYKTAIIAYQTAITDTKLKFDGAFDLSYRLVYTEPDIFRDFARYRLVVSHVILDEMDEAFKIRNDIKTLELLEATNIFLNTFMNSRNLELACKKTNEYAAEMPKTWEYLHDWGYANPTFRSEDFCLITNVN